MTSLAYVRVLSEDIGPRGSTTAEEAKAADYVVEQLSRIGLSPERQPFLSATSAYRPYTLAAGLILLSIALFWQPQPVGAAAAALITSIVLGSLLLEMQFRSNLLRWLLPMGQSQNVHALISCRSSGSQPGDDESVPMGATGLRSNCPRSIVVTAHLDTHRTPFLFRSSSGLAAWRALMQSGVAAVALLLGLFVVGIVTPAPAPRVAALGPGLIMVAIFALTIHADLTPFNKGANDNASGVAATLWLAEQLSRNPLAHTRVYVVFTGCGEVGCYGADAWFSAHRAELGDAIHIVLDRVATAHAQPVVARGERFLRTAHSDAGLLKLAEKLIQAHPEWNARLIALNAGWGELSIGVMHQLRSIAFSAAPAEDPSPHRHQPSDSIDTVDETTLTRVQEMIWAFLQELDQQIDRQVDQQAGAAAASRLGEHFRNAIGSTKPEQA
ncbi:MAG: M28 family peptidase [Anaerolineae bacterium]|nr:M28 family peptidase [Thermoflexales bacterium]MDW8407108.1 M28 family peptidase [Anaerolineae bacterium]